MPEGGSPPTEFRIWKFGENDTLAGPVVLDDKSAKKVIEAFSTHGVDLAIDYEHQTFGAEKNGKPAPAAGWFKPEVREDGLYAASVQWTDEASGYLKSRQYRYFSPTAIIDAKSRKPVKLMPMALTNWPATKNLVPLVARVDSTPEKENRMNTVLVALGLKADADETEAFAAVNALREFEREAIALSGGKNAAEAIGALLALKAKAEKADALETELTKLRADQAANETKSLLDAAIVGGVDPAKRPELEAYAAKHGVEALKFTVSLLPKKAPAAVPPAPDVVPAAAVGMFSAEQVELIKQIGADPVAVAKHKAQSPAYSAANSEDK